MEFICSVYIQYYLCILRYNLVVTRYYWCNKPETSNTSIFKFINPIESSWQDVCMVTNAVVSRILPFCFSFGRP